MHIYLQSEKMFESVKKYLNNKKIILLAFAIGVLFVVLGYYFKLAVVVAVAAIFLGLCLRVVKNVIEKATEIKAENDLTV